MAGSILMDGLIGETIEDFVEEYEDDDYGLM